MKFEIEIPDELMVGLDYAISKGEPMERKDYIQFVIVKACENYINQKKKDLYKKIETLDTAELETAVAPLIAAKQAQIEKTEATEKI